MRPIITLFFFTVWLTACQHKTKRPDDNKQLTYKGDTVIYLSESDNKIELLKPNYPELEYFTEQDTNELRAKEFYNAGEYVKDNRNEKPITLKNGELIVYNRFYEMEEKLIFKDSLITESEYYYKGILLRRELNYYKDSIFVTSNFDFKGIPLNAEIYKRNNETEKFYFYKNGTLSGHSRRIKLFEIKDFWTEKGYFEKRLRWTFKSADNADDIPINQEELNRDNKLIKKIN